MCKQSIQSSLICCQLITYPYCPHHLPFLIFLNILFAKKKNAKKGEEYLYMCSNLHVHALDRSWDLISLLLPEKIK